jgi:hypothetical protein
MRCYFWDRPNFEIDAIFIPLIAEQQQKFFDKFVEYITYEETWTGWKDENRDRFHGDPIYEEEKEPNIMKTPLPPEMKKYGYYSVPDGTTEELYPDVKKMYPDNGLLREEI